MSLLLQPWIGRVRVALVSVLAGPVAMLVMGWAQGAAPAAVPQDTLAQRLVACTACHGAEGRAGPDGFYPRLAGKPEGYLYNQLLNFRDGRRHYGAMVSLVDHLSDDYLREIARYFSQQDLPYPPPRASTDSPALLQRGRQLVTQGDPARRLPACVSCHGISLTGVAPAIPGLLGLPRDYLAAQLGAWTSGQRHAQRPDCMADVVRPLQPEDVSAITGWLSSQPWPIGGHPAPALTRPLPRPCGGVTAAAPSPPMLAPVPSAQAERGAYLAKAGNCISCHTVRGGQPFAGSRALATPFGAVYSSNLTPDAGTGLGRWTADDFWRAMHHGVSRDGRWLYPVFPYPNYTLVTRADSDALWAYLRTLAPVRQVRPQHELAWPFSTQAALGVWRTLFFKPGEFQPDTARSSEWNRGAYLVRGLGHCSACHDARNALGATTGLELSGGLMPVQNWYAPSLRDASEAGVAAWPREDIVALLHTGVAPQGRAQGPMAEVVYRSTQHLSVSDLQAMATFLKALPQAPATSSANEATPAPPARMAQGARLYEHHCATCHGAQGQGVRGLYPALAGNRMVRMSQAANLVRAIARGGFGPATAGHPRPFGMPPFAQQLSDDEIAALATFVRQSWGAQANVVDTQEVSRYRTGGDD